MRNILIIFLCAFLSIGAASRSFDGTDDEIDMGDILEGSTGNASLCAWTKLTEDAGADVIIGKKPTIAVTSDGYLLYQNSSDVMIFHVSDATEGVTSTGVTDTDGAWFFTCGTWNATSEVTRIYLNGVQEDTDTGGGAVDSLTTTAEFAIGEDGNEANDALGLIAYGMQFSSEITVVEVNEYMWKPGTPMIGTRGGLWPLWGDDPEINLVGNGFTGTVNNATTSADGPPVMFGGGLPL